MAADLVVVLHAAFVVFAVLGGLLALRWPRILWLQVPCAAWAVLVELAGWPCPLTPLEQVLRGGAQEAGGAGGFVERRLVPLVYPPGLTRAARLELGLLALALNAASYTFVYTTRRRRTRDAET